MSSDEKPFNFNFMADSIIKLDTAMYGFYVSNPYEILSTVFIQTMFFYKCIGYVQDGPKRKPLLLQIALTSSKPTKFHNFWHIHRVHYNKLATIGYKLWLANLTRSR